MKITSLTQFLEMPEPLLKNTLSLVPGFIYSRQHDDTDGLPLQNLLIKTDTKNNVGVRLEFEAPITKWINFNAVENGGTAHYTHRALMIVAAAIQLDNQFGYSLNKKNGSTLDNLLCKPVCTPNIRLNSIYKIAGIDPDNCLSVCIAHDGDAHVFSDEYFLKGLRFRNCWGGGRSLRTHQALYLLASAIYRDNNQK